jgi:hypothetical protein
MSADSLQKQMARLAAFDLPGGLGRRQAWL